MFAQSLNLLVVAILYISSFASAHNVLLPANGRRCFYENLKKDDEFTVSFQYGNRDSESNEELRGDLVIFGQNRNDILVSIRDVTYGEQTLTAPYTGKFEYCFLNERSGVATKDVSFNIWGTKFVDVNDEDDTLEGSVRKLTRLINEVKNEQEYLILRERTHRNTAESTNDRVKWWSIAQLGVVVVNTVFQIFYLKRFFEVTSIV
ncbi:hypothetical protein TPHA_0D01080 [Tetrapisispora phaffii CBS 4417]|uniref:GOLD domain-containing protein n=1 Tax=Tetrapisispora phaffii (strain ATCC 24235 / CBS 4417 / NBRC 1672 / NRRL Y-8282 / UCD 70-5) TaxID=1071381 RepID=G8BSC8_TETPH|nr:hypothetical protein TPHA_0D01080 [Tetrapisispora phaffii CBS 4417]CCE62749.1 hypothetical protein TPHA_0D01080 [Tetrapisispora phaffii CBS 4417]